MFFKNNSQLQAASECSSWWKMIADTYSKKEEEKGKLARESEKLSAAAAQRAMSIDNIHHIHIHSYSTIRKREEGRKLFCLIFPLTSPLNFNLIHIHSLAWSLISPVIGLTSLLVGPFSYHKNLVKFQIFLMRFDELSWAVKKAICSLLRVRWSSKQSRKVQNVKNITRKNRWRRRRLEFESLNNKLLYILYISSEWMDGDWMNIVLWFSRGWVKVLSIGEQKRREEKRKEEKVYWKDLRWKIIISPHPTTMILMKRKFRCDIIWLMILHDLFRVIQSKSGKKAVWMGR